MTSSVEPLARRPKETPMGHHDLPRHHVLQVVALIALLLAQLVVTTSRADAANPYNVGTGPLAGTREAARIALNQRSCSGLTVNKLTAAMLSIPVHELLGGSRTLTPSPMTLSRWDGWSSEKNRPLYSHGTYRGYKRAHWNPGVGLWQLDTWSPSLHMNHGQRILTSRGGRPVARYLRDGFCNGTIQSRLNNTWFACRWGKCWSTYREIYNFSNNTLNIDRNSSVSQWDGGVTSHQCRWGSSGSSFLCRYVNVNNIQGYADLSDPRGLESRTPLAKPFLSFSTSSKYATWLRGSTGFDKEIVRWAPKDTNARWGGNWYDGTSLQVHKCGTSSCWWSTWGLDP